VVLFVTAPQKVLQGEVLYPEPPEQRRPKKWPWQSWWSRDSRRRWSRSCSLDALALCHGPATPVRHARRFGLQGRIHDCGDLVDGWAFVPGRPRC
jgi:hypothetical protein